MLSRKSPFEKFIERYKVSGVVTLMTDENLKKITNRDIIYLVNVAGFSPVLVFLTTDLAELNKLPESLFEFLEKIRNAFPPGNTILTVSKTEKADWVTAKYIMNEFQIAFKFYSVDYSEVSVTGLVTNQPNTETYSANVNPSAVKDILSIIDSLKKMGYSSPDLRVLETLMKNIVSEKKGNGTKKQVGYDTLMFT